MEPLFRRKHNEEMLSPSIFALDWVFRLSSHIKLNIADSISPRLPKPLSMEDRVGYKYRMSESFDTCIEQGLGSKVKSQRGFLGAASRKHGQ